MSENCGLAIFECRMPGLCLVAFYRLRMNVSLSLSLSLYIYIERDTYTERERERLHRIGHKW